MIHGVLEDIEMDHGIGFKRHINKIKKNLLEDISTQVYL
jgi:hypothetical protein